MDGASAEGQMTEPLMQYLPPSGGGALKYTGQVASGYDAKREQSPKWVCEQRIIEDWIDEIPEGSVILDAPCGTGRFFAAYARNEHRVYGLDISPDMLQQAAAKVKNETFFTSHFHLGIGDVRSVPLEDKSVDYTINCRITRWLSPEDNVRMMKEMQRVARKGIIWTARVANHPHARTRELFESALDGWRITRDEAGYEMAYRIMMAEPV